MEATISGLKSSAILPPRTSLQAKARALGKRDDPGDISQLKACVKQASTSSLSLK